MVKLVPQDSAIRRYIEYYWVIEKDDPFVENETSTFEFPSLAPELILGLRGTITYTYKGSMRTINGSALFTCLDEKIQVNMSRLKQAVVVRFCAMGLAAFTPFSSIAAKLLITQAEISAKEILHGSLFSLEKDLEYDSPANLVDQLDAWFKRRLINYKSGLVSELYDKIQPTMTVQDLIQHTSTSYSTLERHFKNETGLSPKQFLIRNRFRCVIEEIGANRENDWFDLVARYQYFDQTHFIKEINRFSGFVPTELVNVPWLRRYRPDHHDEILL